LSVMKKLHAAFHTGPIAVASLATLVMSACSVELTEYPEEYPEESPEESITLESTALTACPATNVIADPPQFQWTFHPVTANNPEPYYSGTMEIGEATFTINGQTLTTRAYRQAGGAYSIPGPTIKMEPGNKYVLSFHNTLPFAPLSPLMNDFKDPNVSNLHTHGLHISGESPGDDVMRSFEGGFGGDFVYDIPADHMGGTYWYHAHHHGSTFLQVSGGAFGQLIIDDGNDGIPANVAAMVERQLVVAFLDPAAAGTGGDTLMSGTLSPTWTVNGQVQGNFCMPANEWQHWRVLLADRNAMAKMVEVGPQCEVALLARDGVWRTTAPKMLTTNSIMLTGASRADLAVRCSGDSHIMVGSSVVAHIMVSGAGDTAPHPFAADGVSTWSANRPAYLRDLRSVGSVNKQSVRMGARTVNGAQFDHAKPTFMLEANKVQEWSISGAAMHPFHLHVYHVQTLGCGEPFEDGEYYDVVDANCTVRFDLNAATSSVYNGHTIMHCHILAHEDQGAMGWMHVHGGGEGPPTFPADGDRATPFLVYYPISSP
jgi:FtsP/CotA-like multicopper oxidase with cupredoxin domain